MLKLLAIIGVFCVTTSWGQTFDNIRVQKDEDKIIIVYDLISIERGGKVNVRIFSSSDDYKLPLKNISGDIGIIIPGPNKRIHWQVGEEIAKDYQKILFKFEGQALVGWKIVNPTSKKIKRGKKTTIQWQGGFEGDEVTLEFIRPGVAAEKITVTKNSGAFVWKTPRNLTPGSGYALRLTSGENSVDHRFSIKRKIPRGYYFTISAAGLAVLVVNFLAGDSHSVDLPDAPLPN